MTQKRYIKLLMSHGIPRNNVRKLVNAVKRQNYLRENINHIAKWSCEFLRVPLYSYSDLYAAFLEKEDDVKRMWGLK